MFPTRVKLQPPPTGPTALRHLARMQQDAAEAAEEENYRVAAAVAASRVWSLPWLPPKLVQARTRSRTVGRGSLGEEPRERWPDAYAAAAAATAELGLVRFQGDLPAAASRL